MDDLERTLVRAIAATLCILFLSVAGCSAHTDYRISKDIVGGADPLEAACAHNVDPGSEGSGVCAIIAAKRLNQ